MRSTLTLVTVALTAVIAAAQKPAPKVTATGHINKPVARVPDASFAQRLKVPAGFQVTVFARDLGRPRMMAAGPDGTIYVTRWETNDVVALRDTGKGAAAPRVVAAKLDQVHGIALHEREVYLASPTTIWTATIGGDGIWSAPREVVGSLPDGGQHRARNIGVGPDGLLYVSIGSSCNDCAEAGKERATLQRMERDGSRRTTVARGLRHTIGFAWHPQTRELWGTDNGSDWKGDETPPEELNQLREGADYGWPICYGKCRTTPMASSIESPTAPARASADAESCAAVTSRRSIADSGRFGIADD